MIKSILLSVDGSSYTDAVVDAGIYLAKSLNCHVKVLSVIDVRPQDWQASVGSESIVPIIPTVVGSEENQDERQSLIDKTLATLEAKLRAKQVDYSIETINGLPVECICDHARVVDLVIMGIRGEYHIWHSNMIGSTLGPVSRQLERPFLVVGEKFEPFGHVLIAYDGSPAAAKALTMAGYIASSLGLKCTLLVLNAKEDDAGDLIREGRDYLKKYEIECSCVFDSGSAAKKICEYSKDSQINLVIMGAYGHSRIYEILWGSTTEEVMKHAEIPVLLVK
ncbi:MAG: universal stress protein [Calditrichaeota bacterium]|nr:MAG: universal stress protein [Calditrichota bacterium]